MCSVLEPFELRHDNTNEVSVRPAKTQISLGIRDSDRTGRMPRLIFVFAGRTFTLLVLSCCGSFITMLCLFDFGTMSILITKNLISDLQINFD